VGFNKKGQVFDSEAEFFGGISVSEGDFSQSVTATRTDDIDIRGHLSVEAAHVEQLIDILVVVAFQPFSAADMALRYLMLDENGTVLTWDGYAASLV